MNKVICFKDDKTPKGNYRTMHISMVANPGDTAVYLNVLNHLEMGVRPSG